MPRHIKISRANFLEHVLSGWAGLKRVLASQQEEQEHAQCPRVDRDTGILLVLHNLWSSVPFRAN
jgi:hypothetical protein